MYPALYLPMMMFGRFRSERVKKDDQGQTIYKTNKDGSFKFDKNGNKIPEKKKVWIEHKRENGDPGIYPSVNHIYTRLKNGRQKLTKPAERLFEEWHQLAKEWAEKAQWGEPKEEKVVIELTAYFPRDKKKRDVNNVFKLMMDAFEGIIYTNDVYALPRVMDYQTVQPNEEPYFLLNIYKKADEEHVYSERGRQNGLDLSTIQKFSPAS